MEWCLLKGMGAWVSFRPSLDCTKGTLSLGVPYLPLELYKCSTPEILIRKKAVLVPSTLVPFSSVCFRHHGDPWLNEVNKYC